MRSIFIVALLLAASTSWASQATFFLPKSIDMMALIGSLRAAHFHVDHWGTDRGRPYLVLAADESKDPTGVIQGLDSPDVQTIRELSAKLKAGTATSAEKDQLLLLLVTRFLAER